MLALVSTLDRGVRNQEGQGMVEYALIVALVAIALITALGVLSGGLSGVFSELAAAF